MSKETARSIVSANKIEALNYIIKNLKQPESELDAINLCYEISLIKPDLLIDHFDDIATCLDSQNRNVRKFTLLVFSNFANKKWHNIWECRDKVCDIITTGDVPVLESGLSLFLEMAKFGDEKIKNESSHCVLAILEILPVESLQKFTKVIAESDILFKEKHLRIIDRRIGSLK
ncbi:MAG: hypothetical protein AB7O73_11430 [Bacteroidia bacterium]